ncbi:MAG: hypothetical protein ACR2LX_05220 [Jatrophihabitans sp.]
MSTTTTPVPGPPSLPGVRSYWRQLRRIERASYLIGAVLIASGLLHVGVFAIDGGPLYGPVSWRKPITFGLSFGTTLITVTWVASYLILSPKARAWLLGIFAADCVLEVAGITIQAWRHVPSHFNTGTPLNTVIAMNLAVGGGVLIAVLGALTATAFRGRIEAAPDLRLALRAGFAFLMIGLAIGASMIARGEILIKSGHRQAGYDTAGGLKWVHGVTLHAILVLPALALFLAHRGWDEQHRTRAVTTAIGVYSLAAVAVLVISLAR